MIRIKKADKYYNRGRQNQLHVIHEIDLSLPDTGMVAIFGRSGCGKTTLLNTVGGLDTLDRGKIEFGDLDIRREGDLYRNKYIGYIFQNYNLNRDESVFENVADALRLCGMTDETEIRERVTAALANVDMERYAARLPDALSGGQQQRVAIARALVKAPAVILADEPTGNLDEANTVMIMDLLKALSKERLVLLVTHEANLVAYYCDRVIELLDGRVVGDHANETGEGYIVKDKNDIFLGELPCAATQIPGVKLEVYGEPAQPLDLKIVCCDGRIYLQSDTPGVRMLDESSEVKLRQGTFHPAEGNGKAKEEHSMDMSHLRPFEGHHFGRLFTFKKSLSLAWRTNYGKKRKIRDRFLRLVLVLMAVALVFMTAATAVDIRRFSEAEDKRNPNLFYIDLEQVKDSALLRSLAGDHGIDYTAMHYAYSSGERYVSFRPGRFVSSKRGSYVWDEFFDSLSCRYTPIPLRYAEKMELVAGKSSHLAENEVVITTAMADQLLAGAEVDFLDDYESLLGVLATYQGYVVGIVRSEERLLFVQDDRFLKNFLAEYPDELDRIASVSDAFLPIAETDLPASGELLYDLRNGISVFSLKSLPDVGSEALIFGIPFTVKGCLYTPDYDTFCRSIGFEPMQQSVYAAQEIAAGRVLNETEAGEKWFWEEYLKEFPAYCEAYREENRLAMLYAQSGDPVVAASFFGRPYDYYCYLVAQEFGHFPRMTEEDEKATTLFENLSGEMRFEDDYDALLFAWQDQLSRFDEQTDRIYLSDGDLAALTGMPWGRTQTLFGDSGEGKGQYEYFLVHSTDPASAGAFLNELCGEEAVISPQDLVEEYLVDYRLTITASAVGIAVIIALMSLCVFFLMRSALMTRVKEIGIYRAIGVSKKNLVFLFFVESLLLTAMTVFLGYFGASLFVGWVGSMAAISELLYFPLPLALGIFVVITAATILAGILPVILLLRKTPAAILAKYDI